MRLLVVEDEPHLLQTIVQALAEGGYAVDAAADGVEGLFKAESGAYDAIVLDWMLPGLDGIGLLKKLRLNHATPVLLLTAKDTIADRVHGLDAGADDYLVKPFALSELRARLRALIRRAAGKATSILEIGGITIDTSRRTVNRGEQAVPLTAREYALVELLALNQGRLVTRTTIYEKLFDEYDDSLSNLVDVHISNVRRKLGRDFIVTRRGQGYLIDG